MATEASLLAQEAADIRTGGSGLYPGLYFGASRTSSRGISAEAIASIRGAPYIIAPSDALVRHRRMAHVVCDGTRDEEQIQDAIDVVGGDILLLPGTFSLQENGTNGYALLLDRDNLGLLFAPGAILQAASGTGYFLIRLGTPYVSGPLPTIRRNMRLEGPGDIDANLLNVGGIQSGAFTGDIFIGGGLRIRRCRGGAGNEPLTVHGQNIGGQPFAAFWNQRALIDHLFVSDCDEGVFVFNCKDMIVNRMFVDGINLQDAFEVLSYLNLVVTNSHFRNSFGSALDIFSSSTATQTYEDATFSNCHFGPMTTAGDVVSLAAQAGGSDTITFKKVKLIGCHVNMENAARGVALAVNSGEMTLIEASLIGCTIDGTGAATGADGVGVGPDATRTLIAANNINNCPGAAIDRIDDPAELHMKVNSGWGNGSGISAGAGADNVDFGNDL